MDECFVCGVSGDVARLYDAISTKRIVKICRNCAIKEDMPVIKKSGFSPKPEETLSIKERLSKMSGLPKGYKKAEKSDELKKQEFILRNVADANVRSSLKSQKREDLIDNFQWVIMRARRLKHLTQGQVAEKVHEPEVTIKMAEQGILPKDYHNLIAKLEALLETKLRKSRTGGVSDFFSESLEQNEKKQNFAEDKEVELKFDEDNTRNLTISDLQEMKKKKSEKKFFGLFGKREKR